MRFLELNEIADWCAEHGIAIDDDWKLVQPPSMKVIEHCVYASGASAGREPAIAGRLLRGLGEWTECLLWVVQWGVWPSTEDWPTYYAARGAHGERRSLQDAPGHLFGPADGEELVQFLAMVLSYAWHTEVLPTVDKRPSSRRLFVSHDEWAEVREISSVK